MYWVNGIPVHRSPSKVCVCGLMIKYQNFGEPEPCTVNLTSTQFTHHLSDTGQLEQLELGISIPLVLLDFGKTLIVQAMVK